MKKSLISIRNIMPVLAAGLFLATSCSKDNSNNGITTATGKSYVSVTNASASSSLYNVYDDSTNITTSGQLAFGSTTGSPGNPYETINSGTHQIKLSADGTTFVMDTAFNFAANQHYSVFAYDTAMAGSGIKTLILQDNLSTVPAASQSEVRFLPLSPNTSALSIWLINGTDTVSLKNLSYIGSTTYSADSLAAYSTVNAGTYQVVINNAENVNVLNADSVMLVGGKIYTLYSKGYSGLAGTTALSVGVIQQN
jgi:hypothetical protein